MNCDYIQPPPPFISICCFQQFELCRRKDTWKKMLFERLFVSTMLYKCQNFFYLALISCLTFYNSHVCLQDILEEFLFELPFYVWIAQSSSYPWFVPPLVVMWNGLENRIATGVGQFNMKIQALDICYAGPCLEELQWTVCLNCFVWATGVNVF